VPDLPIYQNDNLELGSFIFDLSRKVASMQYLAAMRPQKTLAEYNGDSYRLPYPRPETSYPDMFFYDFLESLKANTRSALQIGYGCSFLCPFSSSFIIIVLQYVDPLLGNDLETNNETTSTARQQISNIDPSLVSVVY
jgi:hypothetical protein